MNIGERILLRIETLKERGWPEFLFTPTEMAKRCGIDRANFYQLKDGKMQTLRAHNLIAVADFLGCEIRWLATGRGHVERKWTPEMREMMERFEAATDEQRAALLGAARCFPPNQLAHQRQLLLPPPPDESA